MSNHASESRGPGSDGNRRGGQGRRRNQRSGNRSGNRNGNRNGNRGGQRGGNRGGQGRRDDNSPRRRTPQPAPLTFWQKILKAIGLYDPNKPAKRSIPSRVPKPDGPSRSANPSADKRRSGPKAGTRNARSEPKPVETNRLYVGNLSYDATEIDLQDLFNGAGTVSSVEIVYNRNTHRSKGYAFIEMNSIEEAKRAVETLHDQSFMDRQLIVSGAKSKGPADGNRSIREDEPAPPSEEVTSQGGEPDEEADTEDKPRSGPDSEEAA